MVFHLIDQNAEKSKVLLAKFSDILRYHLYQSEDEKVPLSLEIEHMKNYVEMEELRRGDMLEASYNISDEIGYIEIPPLILLSFVENAFKHVSTDFHTKNWIHIHIYPQSEWLEIFIENTVKKETDQIKNQQPGGLGLANIRKRLEIIYGEKHSLKITDDQKTFKVLLTIKMI
ncbi:MAG: histidine kinase [Bacteroidota bacterium]